jgi:hypothetical protein
MEKAKDTMTKMVNPPGPISVCLGTTIPRNAPIATTPNPFAISHHIFSWLIFRDLIIIPKYIGKGIMPKIKLEAVPVIPYRLVKNTHPAKYSPTPIPVLIKLNLGFPRAL